MWHSIGYYIACQPVAITVLLWQFRDYLGVNEELQVRVTFLRWNELCSLLYSNLQQRHLSGGQLVSIFDLALSMNDA